MNTHRTLFSPRRIGWILVGCVLGFALAGTGSAAQQVTALVGARIWDGTGAEAISNGLMLVRDGRITYVGERGDVPVPSGAAVVNLNGRTIIPGLINTHGHVGSVGGSGRENLIAQLRLYAEYGVTTVNSLGGEGPAAVALRDEQSMTGLDRARVFVAGAVVTGNTVDAALAIVQRNADMDVDWMKLRVDDNLGSSQKMSPQIYSAVIDRSHELGLRLASHMFYLSDAKALLRAGTDFLAHSIRDMDVDDEVVELFAERPTVVLVPNLPNPGVATDLSWLSGTIPPDELQQMQERSVDRPAAQEAFGIQARNLARLSAEGVTIGFGTDGGAGWSPHAEMEDMVRAGMTPADVIVAATRNSADLLALDDLGTLEAGKSADFVVLEANPLDDITNTRRIVDVYLRGTAVDRAALSASWVGQ